MHNILSVIQLNTYIKRIFEKDYVLKDVSVEGELSNFKRHSSGHIYFTLKDDKAQVSCVLFKTYLSGIEKELHDGARVVISGSVSLYEKSGQYQIYVRKIEKAGIGDLYVLFEKLKKQLQQEGLFDEHSKLTIPKYATKIGIITSATGAAIQDIVQITKRRNPFVELVLYPSLVQGMYAKDSIVKGIRYFNIVEPVDVLIVGRGGGSIEDLWPFNEEVVARAIFDSKIPIISAVGHETDFTIADFVSDLRAPTPSAAAELAVFDYMELSTLLMGFKQRIQRNKSQMFHLKREALKNYSQRLEQKHPRKKLEDNFMHLEQLRVQLDKQIAYQIETKQHQLALLREKLEGKSPLKRLEEGYAYLTYNGKALTSVHDINKKDTVSVYLKDGKLTTKVEEIEVM